MAVERRAFFKTAEDLRVHRQRLYRRAAPVFRRRGYRDAGLKELAAACGLSIPALYRYFPSKRDFALYPLSAANRPTEACFDQAPDDPYVHLQLRLYHAAWERRDFLLALRLGAELQSRGGLSDEHIQTFGYHIGLVARLLRQTAPRPRGRHLAGAKSPPLSVRPSPGRVVDRALAHDPPFFTGLMKRSQPARSRPPSSLETQGQSVKAQMA